MVVGSGVTPPLAHAQTVRNAEDLLVVDCLLPGQIRRLGSQATFMSARRPIRTTQAYCQIRGGEYTSYDRANYQTALKVWMESAQTGDPEAMNYVGEIYLKGLGTDPDYDLAQVWFKKAAEKGNNRAKINLGYMYEEGLGVEKDMTRALNLYREASGVTGDELIFESTVQLQLQAKDTQISELKQSVATEQATSEQLREQVKQLQSQLDQRKQALESSQQALNDTQAKLAKARAATGASEAQISQLRAQMQSSADALASAQDNSGGATSNADEIARLKAQLANQRKQFDAQLHNMQARAPAKSKQDWELMKLLENQLVDKQAEVTSQTRAIASLQQRIGSGSTGSGQVVAGSLVMIQPQVFATRGKNTAVIRGAPGAHELIGRVTQPGAVTQVTVNDKPVAVGANGAFKAQVNVPAGGASVQVAATTKAGGRYAMDFNLIVQPGSNAQAVAGDAGGVGTVPANIHIGNSYAVIIGNNTYQDPAYPALESAVSDSTAVSQVLAARYGFHTTLLNNASRLQILTALNTMREKLGPDDNLLIYYAGHGEVQGRQGYWIPVDAKDKTASTWISNAAISDILTTIKARHVLVVADSCYSGTLTRDGVPSFDNGALTPDKWTAWVDKMFAGKSRTALTSGGVQPVPDSGSGKHSYFTRAFLNALQDNTRMLEARRLYRDIASSLALSAIDSPIAQSPGYSPIQFAGHESGDFFFIPKGARTAQVEHAARHMRPQRVVASVASLPSM
jgi:predicted  nucleic acid-binding Zn-ribbon protein